MVWKLVVHPEVRSWLHGLRSERNTIRQVSEAIQFVMEGGPGIGRPIVETISHTSLPNLKEIRPGSSGRSEIRILFAFDPERRMLLLIGGDKAGNWRTWYRKAIPVAEARYADLMGDNE